MLKRSARLLLKVSTSLLIFCILIVTLALYFLSQLDLEDYRRTLENQLSQALKQPVSIGTPEFTFDEGLALELPRFRIGPQEDPLVLVPRLTATLALKPLINRDIVIEQVQLDGPQLKLRLPFPDRPAKGTSQTLINSLGIKLLSVRNATLDILQDDHQGGSIERLRIADLHAVLTGWKAGESGHLVVSAQLPRYRADLLLETELPSSRDPQIWRQEMQQAKLRINRISTAELPKIKGQNYPEALDLEVNLTGIPALGLSFTTRLSATGNGERIFALDGRWTSSPERDLLSDVTGVLLGIPLSGTFDYTRGEEQNSIAARLGTTELPLNPQLLKRWRIPHAEQLLSGELKSLEINANKTWAADEKLSGLPLIDAVFSLEDLTCDIPQLKQFQDLSVGLKLDKGTLAIRDGILVLGGNPLEFSGRIHNLFLRPDLALQVSFQPDLETLTGGIPAMESWQLAGRIPGDLTLNGPLDTPDFSLQVNLDEMELSKSPLLIKQATDKGSLLVQGTLTHDTIVLERGVLRLGDAAILATGAFTRDTATPEYQLALEPIELAQLIPLSPLMQRLQARGTIGGEVISDDKGVHSNLQLDKVGAHLTRILGDLENTSGEVQLDRYGLSFIGLNTALGESPLVVDGLLTDWSDPQLSLDVRGTNIRARDLIFANPDMRLYDLKGHLHINAGGISFDPVDVRLEDETLATVFGSVSDFSDPHVNLDIQAKTANVLDVIKVFQGPPKGEHHAEHKKEGNPILIKVAAEKGTLGGLHFTNASGLITDHQRRFVLYPLEFNNGGGWCQARVEHDRNEEDFPLKISGHAKGIEASLLHQDLFQSHGLIDGTLDGDFYLEGNTKDGHFWHTARGGIHMEVFDGVLRKFRTLASVFSVLNISQIFTGSLPDMDKEGMPFALMEGSVRVGDGQLRTDDLKITSEAMNLSLVGTQSLVDDKLDFVMGVMPLRAVDKVLTKIPIAGWLFGGENEALVTALFEIKGTSKEPEVEAIPFESLSKAVGGFFKRAFNLPEKLIKDIGGGQDKLEKKESP
ncbi:MAG: hypothetical protein C0622_14055 [Desulfuromonas sp.]|nr:MAG: hypothetical protein C0622_14055 [Desulfuromonas sp.]